MILLYGQFFPASTLNWSSKIFYMIEESININDSGTLLLASFSYISWNALTFIMIYYGAMLLSYALTANLSIYLYHITYTLLVLLNIFIYNITYHQNESYIAHIVLITILLTLQNFIPKQTFAFLPHSIIFSIVMFSVNWLDLIPAITNWGFGTDDLAISIKVADGYLTGHKMLNNLSTTFFITFLSIAFIITVLTYILSNQIITLKKYQEQSLELAETKDALLESSVYKEIHTLVHDLKTPLVTIEGLISLLSLRSTQDNKSTTYFQKISDSVDKMKDMISEILSENIKREMNVAELVSYITSHLSLDETDIEFEVKIDKGLKTIFINKIRLARAISNVIENAILSLGEKGGTIKFLVTNQHKGVLFTIEDNGPGIDSKNLNRIWLEGFSTKNSSGVGLPFVKRVVENHNGNVEITSKQHVRTKVNIYIPYKDVGL